MRRARLETRLAFLSVSLLRIRLLVINLTIDAKRV
jgi:hypothetical protein